MKKEVHFLLMTLGILVLVLSMDLSAQSFDNGNIEVTLNDWGRIRVYDPATGGTQQLERASLLVASGETSVFDYKKDAETIDTSQTVPSPEFSDYELYVSCDNSYLVPKEPPDVLEKVNVYGWNQGSYGLVKFTVFNMGASEINAIIGLEFIPYIDEIWGLETVEFLPASEVVMTYTGESTHMGYKILSDDIVSLKTFDWYDGYSDSDPDYFDWLTYSAYDTVFTSEGFDGVVSIMAQNTIPLAASDSAEFWIGIAMGTDGSTMLANMDSAAMKYDEIIATSIITEPEHFTKVFSLHNNYPNPFNPQTTISFDLPEKDMVNLKIYNLIGQEIATLVNQELNAGTHQYSFNAQNLPSGLYLYTLQTGSHRETKKMMLMK